MLVKMLVYVTLAVVLLAAPLCRAEVEYDVGGRSKRGPTVGLFAFPRVGRSDPELASVDWDPTAVLPAVDLADDYEDYPIQEIKRQGLVPFPRVGRSGGGAKSELGGAAARYWLMARALQQQQRALQQQMLSQPSLVKRAGGSGANSGMWFGPRLGKRSRSGTASQVGSAEQQQQQQQLAKGDQL